MFQNKRLRAYLANFSLVEAAPGQQGADSTSPEQI